ncbi:MFS transporter [Paraburkholderia sp. C35]|uniref:MFS transporter n=1 Tax=Paraburkholderia sp. C35 TaxID=2126993 RepID=UPI000D699F8C|nr:MFS transporter [Paraburkholderia sp. C35]
MKSEPVALSRAALAVLFVGAFLTALDFFIVNLALPAIHAGIGATHSQLQFVISAYASAYAVLLITGGRLGDLYGRRRMFMAGMAGFILASALCGLATSGQILVLARIAQGLAAAIMGPQVLATIRALVPERNQTRVMGVYGFVFGVAAIVGQLGGGALITFHPFGLDWRGIFLLNVPIGLLALLGAWRFLPAHRPTTRPRSDVAGVLLLSLMLLLVMYPLTHGREAGWPVWTLMMFALAAPVCAGFVLVERHAQANGRFPLVDLQLFRTPAFSLGLLLSFLFYCNSAFFFTYGMYLQTGLHWTPLASGIAVMPFALGFAAGPLTSPAVVRRLGAHVLTLGFALLACGFTVTGWAAAQSALPGWPFYAGLVIAGIGQGLILPSIVRIVLAEAEPEKAGVAAGVVASTLQIGAALGTAAISGAFFSALGTSGGHPTPAVYAHAFDHALSINALLMVVCIVLTVLMIRRQRLAGQHTAAAPQPAAQTVAASGE